ncbi:Methyl-CpG-binding domain protein 6 [Geodia barretti]|uniref:Methyl-CpG-binding domain protein 6 n=1 Tax=Geodia barretti TaxID=519541 RepID=A0AA35SV08_GEOBA|nr:Methyl-CpG-binding domain protein 6 [Geodia barretti]
MATAAGYVVVPLGWERDVLDGRVIYKSPDLKTLTNREELLLYLTSDGTCKCGLRCPFQLEDQFNFDPLVLGLPDNGVPSIAQASCRVGHALRTNATSPASVGAVSGGWRVPQRMGKPRNSRPSRHSTRRSGENIGSLSVRSLGTRMVTSIDAAVSPANQLSISSNCQEVKDGGEGGGGVSEDGVKKMELDSPTKLVQSIPEMSVRGLLSRLPGSHSPSPQQTRQSDDRNLSEERQGVAKMAALRLMQSQKEAKQSEKSSPTLSAVLTGCSQNDIVGEEKKEGDGNKGGSEDVAKERKKLECELTISIKLNGHEESKDATPVNADGLTGKEVNPTESESGNRSTGDRGMGDRGMELGAPSGSTETRSDRGSESATLDISSTTTPFSESAQLDPTCTTNTAQPRIESTISETDRPVANVTAAELLLTGDVSHSQPNGTTESTRNSPTFLQVNSTTTTVQSSPLQPYEVPNTLSVASSPDTILQPLHPTPLTPPPSAHVPSQTSLTGSEPAIAGDFECASLQEGIFPQTPPRVPEDVPVTNFSEASSILHEDCQTRNVSLNYDPSLFGVGVASAVEGAREEDVGLILAESCAIIESSSFDFAPSECLVVSVPDKAHPLGAVPDNAHHVSDNSSLGGTRVPVFESHSHSNGSEWFQNGTETLPTVVHIREALAVKQNGCGHIDEGGVVLDVHFPQKTVLVAHENRVYSDRDSTPLPVPQTKLPRPLQSLSLQLVPSALDTPTSLVAPDDDGCSPPISELSSLTPDSAHFGPSGTSSSSMVLVSPLSSPVPLPSLPGPRWTPQRCEVTLRECRVNLRPLGKEWTPSKKTAITESETLLPNREEEKEAEKGEGEVGRGEEKKKEGESELEVEVNKRTRGEVEEGPGLVPKRLRFTVREQDREKGDGIIPDSVPFQPVDRSVVENHQPPVFPDLEIAQPKITNIPSPAEENYSEQTNTDKSLTAKEEHVNGKNITVSLAVEAVNFSLPSEPGSEGLNGESECLNGGGEGLNGSSESFNEGGKGLTGGSEGVNDGACAGVKQADQREVEGEIDEGLTLEETRPVSVEHFNTVEPDVQNNSVEPSPLPSPPAVMEVNEVNAEPENSPLVRTNYSTVTTTESMESRDFELDEEGSAESMERNDVDFGERGSAVTIEGKEQSRDERGSPERMLSRERELGKVFGGGVVEDPAHKIPELGGGIGGGEEEGGGRGIDVDTEKAGRDGREGGGEGEERQVHGQQFEGVEHNMVENEEKAEIEPNVMKEKGGQMEGVRETEEEFGLLHLLAQVAVDSSPEVDEHTRPMKTKQLTNQW